MSTITTFQKPWVLFGLLLSPVGMPSNVVRAQDPPQRLSPIANELLGRLQAPRQPLHLRGQAQLRSYEIRGRSVSLGDNTVRFVKFDLRNRSKQFSNRFLSDQWEETYGYDGTRFHRLKVAPEGGQAVFTRIVRRVPPRSPADSWLMPAPLTFRKVEDFFGLPADLLIELRATLEGAEVHRTVNSKGTLTTYQVLKKRRPSFSVIFEGQNLRSWRYHVSPGVSLIAQFAYRNSEALAAPSRVRYWQSLQVEGQLRTLASETYTLSSWKLSPTEDLGLILPPGCAVREVEDENKLKEAAPMRQKGDH